MSPLGYLRGFALNVFTSLSHLGVGHVCPPLHAFVGSRVDLTLLRSS